MDVEAHNLVSLADFRGVAVIEAGRSVVVPFHSDEQRIANAAPYLHSAQAQLRKLIGSRIHEQDSFLEGLSLKIEAAEELTKVPRLSAEVLDHLVIETANELLVEIGRRTEAQSESQARELIFQSLDEAHAALKDVEHPV